MKLFVWKMLFKDGKYMDYEGVVLALAETAKEARKLIITEMSGHLKLEEKDYGEDHCIRKLNTLRTYITTHKPIVIQSPVAMIDWGSVYREDLWISGQENVVPKK